MKKKILIIILYLVSYHSFAEVTETDHSIDEEHHSTNNTNYRNDDTATEHTQILNHEELVKQLQELTNIVNQQIYIIRNQIQDLQGLSNDTLLLGANKDNIKNILHKLNEIYHDGQNIANAEKDSFKAYKEMGNINLVEAMKENYSDLFYKWSQENHDTIKGILQQNHISIDWFKDQQEDIASYNNILNTTQGTLSALQAAGKIANAQIDSLNQLGQLQIAQNNILAAQAAIQQSEKDLERAKTLQHKKVDMIVHRGQTAEELRKHRFK